MIKVIIIILSGEIYVCEGGQCLFYYIVPWTKLIVIITVYYLLSKDLKVCFETTSLVRRLTVENLLNSCLQQKVFCVCVCGLKLSGLALNCALRANVRVSSCLTLELRMLYLFGTQFSARTWKSLYLTKESN